MDIIDMALRAISDAELEMQAKLHYRETDSYQGILTEKYRKFMNYFAPVNGDQWPQDRAARPGMIHITHNVLAPVVEIEARVESRLPRITLQPEDQGDPEEQKRAEQSERLHMRWLEQSGWEVWLNDLCKVKSMYGKAFLKPTFNEKDKRPDVVVIENPQNLRVGWGSSDYTVIDWALYEYAISPVEALRRWPGIDIKKSADNGALSVIIRADHGDPLNQLSPTGLTRLDLRSLSDYEGRQVRVWDYWYKDAKDVVTNAMFVEGTLVSGPTQFAYYPDIPYIPVEHDHIPGTPEGMGDIEVLIDIQDELNRALSHWAQLINDETDPAWYVNAETIPGGMVPHGGQILAVGEGHEVKPFEKPVSTFPISELMDTFYDAVYLRSGLSEILFAGRTPGAETAGRALQIQIEAVANRIDPRRGRLYKAIRTLLIFWSEMIERKRVTVEVGGEKIRVGEITKGLRRWKIVAPEITPRDNLESITAVVNKLNAKLISLQDGMDELGVDSPLEMIEKIMAERSNPRLFPSDVQAYAAVIAMLQQLQMQQQAAGAAGGAPAGGTEGDMQAAQQGAAPQGVQGDNGESPPQPATAVGGAPPPGTSIPNQTLIRSTPTGQSQVLQQATFKTE